MHVLDVRTKFSFFGYNYRIAKSTIDVANLGFFIHSHVFILPKQSISLMPFHGPLYSLYDYWNIVKYKHNISMYFMWMNNYGSEKFNRKNLLYIIGSPWTHGNIEGFINSSRSSLFKLFLWGTFQWQIVIYEKKHQNLLLCMQYVVCLLVTSC